MTMIIQNEGTVEAFGLRASRVAVPPSQDQPASDKPPPAGHTVEHVDGDLLQARVLARKHPGSPTALARLASSELSFGNRLSSSRAAQRVIQHDAVDAPALLIASQVLLAVGEIGSAEQALHKLLAADTSEGGARSGAAVLAARIAAHQGEPDKALELLTQSNNPAGSALKGTLLVQMGRYHDAIRVLREALSEVPDAPGTLCTLGYAYAAAGSIRKATRATTAAAALDPADRTAGLNLAALFLTQDRAPEAVVAIDRLTAYHPNDIRLVRAAAAALHASGDTARALRRLREMKVTKAARDATPAQREELQLDILLLDTPPMTRPAVFAAASAALKRCDYRSETIARVLASAAQTTEDLPTLEAAYAELRKHHNRTALLPVESQVSFLRLDFDRCLDAAVDWVHQEPFSVEAHITATYVLSLHAGNYQEAARVGCAGIRRGIRNDAVRNNVAFALAMDGKPDEAARVLPDPSECELALATAGLIEAARRNLDRAITMYEDCARRLRLRRHHDLADLVSMHRLFAEIMAGRTIPDDSLAGCANSAVGTDPRFAIVCSAIAREKSRRA